jgi:HopA1 effector protein family
MTAGGTGPPVSNAASGARADGAGGLARPVLAEPVARALGQVSVSAGCRRATVGGRELLAAGPAGLTPRLARAIYDVLHVGRAAGQPGDGGGPGDADLGLSPRRAASADLEFEARLLAAVPHRTAVRAGRLIAVRHGELLAEVDDVRVRLPRSPDGPAVQGSPAVQDGHVTVPLPAARPALSPGYFVADGTHALRPGPIVRVYVQASEPDELLEAWRLTLAELERRRAAYRAKAVSRPALLPRSDALVVYLGERDLAIVHDLAGLLAGRTGRGEPGSVFTEPVGPGVALAWEPADPRQRMRGLSFGEHRALATAEGLVEHARAGAGCGAAESVSRAFVLARIDPANPARNLPAPGWPHGQHPGPR